MSLSPPPEPPEELSPRSRPASIARTQASKSLSARVSMMRGRAQTSQQQLSPDPAMSSYRPTRYAAEDDAEDAAYRDFAVRTLSDKRVAPGVAAAIDVSMFREDDDDESPGPSRRPSDSVPTIDDDDLAAFNADAFDPPPEPSEDDDDDDAPPPAPTSAVPRALVTAYRGSSPSPSPSARSLVVSGSHGASFRLASEYYEIQSVGGGGVMRHWLSAESPLRPTERAWQALLNAPDLSSVAECGATVLRLLERHFRELPGPFAYKGQQPSHEWDRTSAVAKGLPTKLLARLCLEACQLLQHEPALVRPAEPCYVLGDLHGNYRDLQIFARAFWPLGIDFAPVNALFLGDYVDRGPHSVEVAAYVLALKLVAPSKVFLLRGNHEISELNGNEKAYGGACFRGQCKLRYGERKGEKVWNVFNEVFRFLPVSAVIGERVFCVHGGIPRSVSGALRGNGGGVGVLEQFAALPTRAAQSWTNPTIMDMLWADPATPQDEEGGLRAITSGDGALGVFPDGFAPNKARGPFTCVFGRAVVDQFLQRTGCTHIIRAHQPPRLGVDLRHSGKVITVFSSSHYCGAHNAAAAALVANHTIRIVLASIDQNTLKGDD